MMKVQTLVLQVLTFVWIAEGADSVCEEGTVGEKNDATDTVKVGVMTLPCSTASDNAQSLKIDGNEEDCSARTVSNPFAPLEPKRSPLLAGGIMAKACCESQRSTCSQFMVNPCKEESKLKEDQTSETDEDGASCLDWRMSADTLVGFQAQQCTELTTLWSEDGGLTVPVDELMQKMANLCCTDMVSICAAGGGDDHEDGEGEHAGEPEHGEGEHVGEPEHGEGEHDGEPEHDEGEHVGEPEHGEGEHVGEPEHGEGEHVGEPQHGDGMDGEQAGEPDHHGEPHEGGELSCYAVKEIYKHEGCCGDPESHGHHKDLMGMMKKVMGVMDDYDLEKRIKEIYGKDGKEDDYKMRRLADNDIDMTDDAVRRFALGLTKGKNVKQLAAALEHIKATKGAAAARKFASKIQSSLSGEKQQVV